MSEIKINPQLAKEWHPTKNDSPTPGDITPGNNKKVWWQCQFDHEWQATIANRSKVKGTGCPYCLNRKVNQQNCLATTHLNLAEEWHLIKNEKLVHPKTREKLTSATIVAGSGFKVWWQCQFGHEWQAKICERRGNQKRKGTDCPHCYSQASDAEYRLTAELKLFFSEIKHKKKIEGREADILLEDLKLIIEIDGSYYHSNDEAQSRDKDKTLLFENKGYTVLRVRGDKLPKISKHHISFNCKNIQIDDVKNIIEWLINHFEKDLTSDLKEKLISYSEHKGFQNNELYNQIRKPLPGKYTLGNLAAVRPDLIEEWHPIKNGNSKPENFSLKSGQKVWWQCSKNNDHEWQTKVCSRANGNNCPYCSGKKVSIDNCLGIKNPQLAKEWHTAKNGLLTPRDVTSRSNKKVWWQCQFGHEWQRAIDHRHQTKVGCPDCVSLEIKNPQLAKEWHPIKNGDSFKPRNVTFGSKKIVWWQCSKNNEHEWQASIDSRNRGNNCPICAGKKIHLSNCLATVNPKLAVEWHPIKNGNWTPYDFTRGSKKIKIWWICSRGHEYQALILTRSHGHGCPECARKVKKETALKRWEKYRKNKEFI